MAKQSRTPVQNASGFKGPMKPKTVDGLTKNPLDLTKHDDLYEWNPAARKAPFPQEG